MAECKTCIKQDVCNRDVGHGYSVCHHYLSADVVEIVHCKDCKHWKSGKNMVGCHTNLGENIGECHCSQWENDYFYYLTKDTDFCSYGERKDENA